MLPTAGKERRKKARWFRCAEKTPEPAGVCVLFFLWVSLPICFLFCVSLPNPINFFISFNLCVLRGKIYIFVSSPFSLPVYMSNAYLYVYTFKFVCRIRLCLCFYDPLSLSGSLYRFFPSRSYSLPNQLWYVFRMSCCTCMFLFLLLSFSVHACASPSSVETWREPKTRRKKKKRKKKGERKKAAIERVR